MYVCIKKDADKIILIAEALPEYSVIPYILVYTVYWLKRHFQLS